MERRSSRLFLLIDSSVAQHAYESCLLRALISRVIFIKLNLEEWDWMNLKLCHKCCARRRAPSVNRTTMTPPGWISYYIMFVICVFAFERKKFDSAIISNLLDVFVELERLLNQQAVESCIASLRFPNDNIINTAMMHGRKTERLNII